MNHNTPKRNLKNLYFARIERAMRFISSVIKGASMARF